MDNNEIYENALRKIERDKKCRPTCCFGPTGPMGPTGPQGPATITIGTTTTGDPGTEAEVINSGTIDDVILNFTIPAGPTGPIGLTGPTGPTGATATIDSILVDNDGTQVVASDALVDLGDVINSTGSSFIFTAPDTVSMEPGTYYISYEALISNVGTAGDVGASMLINDTVVNNASEYVPATTTQTQINLQHNVTLTELSTITIQNASTVSNNFHDSSLSIIRLG